MIGYPHLFRNVPQFVVSHTVKGFDVFNKVDINVFLELSCCFNDLIDVVNLISYSFAFAKSRLNIWKFSGHIVMKPNLKNFEHSFASV